MTVRRLVAADVPAYRALMLEAYERHPDAFTSTVAERAALPLSWWEARTGAESSSAELVFGAFHEGQLAGAAGLSVEKREKSRHKATLFGMYVPERFRKLGLGRELVHAVLEHARERGDIKVIQLTVTEGNAAAEGLYARCGFMRFGVEPLAMALGADYLSKVHMWCDVAAARELRRDRGALIDASRPREGS